MKGKQKSAGARAILAKEKKMRMAHTKATKKKSRRSTPKIDTR